MIVIVKPEASAAQLEQLLNRIRELGLTPMVSHRARGYWPA
ncbi:hypothetical protein [Acidithiobacillus caldus]|nr:hypothetical protein [Acidithiobacillus caldus]